MKFMIGIEAILPNSNEKDKMLVQTEDSIDYVDDNLFYLESQDYKSAMEAINAEIGLLVDKSNVLVGTEADDAATAEKKAPLYKRIFEAVMKLFTTLGDWISKGFEWVANKFRKGGANDIAGIAEAEVAMKSEAVQSTKEEMDKEGGLTPTEIKNHVRKILTNESKKHETMKKGLGRVLIKRMVEEVTEAIVEVSEPAPATNTETKEETQKTEDTTEKLVIPESAKIKISYWLFSDGIIENVHKKRFAEFKDYDKTLADLKDSKANGFVRVNATAAVNIVDHCVSLISNILGTNYETMSNLHNKLRVYSKASWAKYESPITVKELGEANQIIREFESTFKDIASRNENIFEMVKKEVEIRVYDNGTNRLNYTDVERFLNTDEFKSTKYISERIVDMCSYISNISKTLVKNVNEMYSSMKSGNTIGINEFGDKVDAKPMLLALKAIAMDVKSIANSTLKIIGKLTTARIAKNAKTLSGIKERSGLN